jgi:hypothetical protein
MQCAHAGLFTLLPAMVELGVAEVFAAGSYPSTRSVQALYAQDHASSEMVYANADNPTLLITADKT